MNTRIEASNYRCFDQLAVSMDNFTVLAGANGSGKTTLLDIPVLLQDLLKSGDIATAFLESILKRGPRAGSLDELLFRGEGESFLLAIEAQLPVQIAKNLLNHASKAIQSAPERHPTHIRYEVQLRVYEGRELRVKSEHLFTFPMSKSYEVARLPIQGENSHQADWRFIIHRESGSKSATLFTPESISTQERHVDLDVTRLGFARLQYESRAEFEAGRWLLDALMEDLLFFTPDWEELRKASRPGLPKRLMASGENIPWLALRLQQRSPRRFQEWIEHIQTALPQISHVEIREREEDHHAYFRVTYESGFVVTSTGLSEGTLRIFALTLIPYIDGCVSAIADTAAGGLGVEGG